MTGSKGKGQGCSHVLYGFRRLLVRSFSGDVLDLLI
jgi:hypothetical protein